jgi:hypothetical protein
MIEHACLLYRRSEHIIKGCLYALLVYITNVHKKWARKNKNEGAHSRSNNHC